MMKSSKPGLKMHKSSRLSPMRKEVMMKKPVHSGSGMRLSLPSRPPPLKHHHLSPGMKRPLNMPPGKNMHSLRMRSIPSSPHRSLARHSMQGSPEPMDRGPMKISKYEKRRHSPSPIRHTMTSASRSVREGPYHDERYLGRPMGHESRFSPPMKMKKGPRESAERYGRSPSPNLRMMHHPEVSRTESRMPPHRGGMLSHSTPIPSIPNQSHRNPMPMSQHDRSEHFDMHSRSHPSPIPVMPPSHLKRPHSSSSMNKSYKDPHPERYRSRSPEDLYSSSKDKHYVPTLNERFSSVSDEPRIKYSREDLEKITIDVHRNLNSPPPRRHIMNPSSVKLVRRPDEGHRPMFDRDEIKQASRDMREEAFYEKRSNNDDSYGSMSIVRNVGREKFVSRDKFDSHSASFRPSGDPSTRDRWQDDPRKEGMNMDRDHREYERTVKKRFVDSRSKSGDQDFRLEKYPRDSSRERPGYRTPSHQIPSPDHRSSMPHIPRKEGMIQDARERLTARRGGPIKPRGSHSDSKGRYPSVSERHYSDGFPSRSDKHYADRRSPETHKWPPKHRSVSRERMPEYSRRPEKFAEKSWPEKRDSSPGHAGYHFEPERYRESEPYHGRGGSRPFRSRDPRGRGGFPSRSFRGGFRISTSARGRGAPRRGRYSPGIWEHN